jgi:hypothetical protein
MGTEARFLFSLQVAAELSKLSKAERVALSGKIE